MRCHSFDKSHTRVLCKEPVFELCPEGHIYSRRCSQFKQPCPVCLELQVLRDCEKEELGRKEKEADRLRVNAEKKRISLAARLERLQQESTVLEEQMKAQKEHISMQLHAQKLEKEIKLQRQQGPAELKLFESEQQAALEKELVAAEEEAATAALDVELKQKAAEEEVVRRQQEQEARLEAAKAELQAQEQRSNAEQQKVRNEAARIERKYEETLQCSEGTADRKRHHLLTMLEWREFLVKKGQEGAVGVSAIREALSSSDEPDATADGIDAALDAPLGGLGKCLVDYSKHVGSGSTAPPSLPPSLQRGINLMASAQWLAACDFFKAAASNPSNPSTSDPEATGLLFACLQLCEAKLALPPSPPPLSPSRPAQASQHPLQHLASALLSAQGFSLPAGPIRTTGPTRVRSYSSQRSVDGQVVGLLLMCLLHPRSAQELPSQLQQEALDLLKIKVQSFSSPGAAVAAAASEKPGGSKGAQAIPEHWQRQAQKLRPLKNLLGLIGMHAIKKDMFSLVDQVDLDKERKRDLQKSNYSCMYYGNPGTGKTTVARIYAELLKDVGVLPEAQVEETSGAALANGGASELKKKLESLKDGGVLFLDEAYQLKPKSNPMGAQVMDLLLPEMENRRGRLVVILAGYKRHMEELISYNEGLPSRFPLVFTFADYSDDELYSMLEKQVEKESFRLEDPKHARIACRRLGRQRGTIGFGNARAVRNLLEWAIKRQSERLVQERQAGGSPDPWLLKRDDLLGPKHIDVSSSAALRSLQGMRGLHSVKRSVDTLLGLIRTNAEAEEMERPVKDVCLNRIFLGNPGTGKTTVANIYGGILRDLGLLSKGDVVVKNPSDFIGTVLGESERNTNAILEATLGSLLVIDEAYGLCSKGGGDVYKEAVIDTLVAKIQGLPGDDRCVLLLGYKQQMEDLLQGSNPGLARRFQMSAAWNFEDYSSEDLLHIMRAAARKNYGWQLPYESLRAGIKVLDQERRRPNFGNAGSVNNLLAAIRKYACSSAAVAAATAAAQKGSKGLHQTCPLPGCHQLDSAPHMLSGCQNHIISNMKTERHNMAGRMITKALSKCPVGAGLVYTDIGSDFKLAQHNIQLPTHAPNRTLPAYFFPRNLPERKRLNSSQPDAVCSPL
ncbi:P-loop containing nucleoside triphosphate hydrolase protein [Dunaliella salina]|uniref:P-loop containing nucleoside triphosphate hydrolase protein n=1 Tax=Dunaliella salina TaxID=3046 RepID=A0ABQ7H203_DUNSA|nr:P-loop containing nucleoside triphosphate hydrolase protein [Dunaliella salina]|eukprot:KAF5840889.1 P-loop containing nucleoside triphosphate hydrolase protein [Dunaliella salina]